MSFLFSNPFVPVLPQSRTTIFVPDDDRKKAKAAKGRTWSVMAPGKPRVIRSATERKTLAPPSAADWDFRVSPVEPFQTKDDKHSGSARAHAPAVRDEDVLRATTTTTTAATETTEDAMPSAAVTFHAPRTPPEERAQPRRGYDSKRQLAFFNHYVEWEEARRRAALVAAELELDLRIDGLQMLNTVSLDFAKRRLDEILSFREIVGRGEGTFQFRDGPHEARLDSVSLNRYRVLQFDVLRKGRDEHEVEHWVSNLLRPPEAPVYRQGASTGSQQDRGSVVASQSSRPSRAGYDGKSMLARFDALSRPSRIVLQYRLEAARAKGPAGRTSAAAAQSMLDALDRQRDCVEAGTGWFRIGRRSVQADVVGVSYKDDFEDYFKTAAILTIKRPGGQAQAWEGGECRADAPAGCCALL